MLREGPSIVGAISSFLGTVELREGSLTALIVTVYQVLVGPAYIYTFSSSALVLGLVLDRFNRPLIMGAGEDDLTATVVKTTSPYRHCRGGGVLGELRADGRVAAVLAAGGAEDGDSAGRGRVQASRQQPHRRQVQVR